MFLLLIAVVGPVAPGCTFNRSVLITSEPTGARVWLGVQPQGRTPTAVRARATGTIPNYTFSPEYVTLEYPGHDRTVRPLRYRLSVRNVVLSALTIVGVPAIFFFGMVPEDTHVELLPDREAE